MGEPRVSVPVAAWLKYETPVALSVLTAFLRTGRMVDHASSVLMLGAIVLASQRGSATYIASISVALLLALIEKYFAWRVALDAELFAVLSRCGDEVEIFDASLAAFLGCEAKAGPRSMKSRWVGAKRLFWRQVIVFCLQAAVVAGSVIYAM